MNTAISAEAQELGKRWFCLYITFLSLYYVPVSTTFLNNNGTLDLLERIFLRLGNAETDQQLEESIGKFLVPILMKLENKYKSVQDKVRRSSVAQLLVLTAHIDMWKVFELLTHISKQLKSRPQVLLPIDDVLACFQGSNASPQLTVRSCGSSFPLYLPCMYGGLHRTFHWYISGWDFQDCPYQSRYDCCLLWCSR